MLNRFDVRSPPHRLLARCTPILSGLFGPPGLVAVLSEPLRLSVNDLRELCLDGRCNKRVELLSLIAQKAAICCVSDECVLEQIGRMRRHTPPEQQTGRNEMV